MATLEHNSYGKHRVRVMKAHRHDDGTHEVCEIEADVLLTGDLDGSYLSDDNSSIVPTDTVKNTVTFLAHEHLGTCRTSFAKVIGEHFLSTYAHLDGVEVELRERRWDRMMVDGKAHAHAFTHAANGTWFAKGSFSRADGAKLSAGITDYLVMKSTGSGFEGYKQCDLTTLPETADRFLSTRMEAEWEFADGATEFAAADAPALEAAHRVFAETYSPSVQRTLYQAGEAILEAVPQITRVLLTMPNVHFIPLDLTKLGLPGQSAVLLPTDEPHGQIIAAVAR